MRMPRVAAERDHAELHVGALPDDERPCRVLRGLHAVRLQVLGQHAPRHVEREDDRTLLDRDRDDGLGPRGAEDHEEQRRDEQRRRDVALATRPLAERLAYQREVRVAQRVLLTAALRPDVRGDERGHDEDEEEVPRPEEVHAIFTARSFARRCLRICAKRTTERTRSVSVSSSSTSTPARRNVVASISSRLRTTSSKRFRKRRSDVSTQRCSPVSASFITIIPISGISRSRWSTRRIASVS